MPPPPPPPAVLPPPAKAMPAWMRMSASKLPTNSSSPPPTSSTASLLASCGKLGLTSASRTCTGKHAATKDTTNLAASKTMSLSSCVSFVRAVSPGTCTASGTRERRASSVKAGTRKLSGKSLSRPSPLARQRRRHSGGVFANGEVEVIVICSQRRSLRWLEPQMANGRTHYRPSNRTSVVVYVYGRARSLVGEHPVDRAMRATLSSEPTTRSSTETRSQPHVSC